MEQKKSIEIKASELSPFIEGGVKKSFFAFIEGAPRWILAFHDGGAAILPVDADCPCNMVPKEHLAELLNDILAESDTLARQITARCGAQVVAAKTLLEGKE